MKNFLLKFILIALIFSIGGIEVFAISSYKVPILVYHSFGPARSKKESSMQLHYRVTTNAFEKQMKYLSDNGYHPISFSNYVNSLKNNMALPDKAVVHNFDIGSHTKTHAMLTKVSSKKLTDELTESKKILEEKLNIKITTLAYPYYAQNIIVNDAVKSAGYFGARGGWG